MYRVSFNNKNATVIRNPGTGYLPRARTYCLTYLVCVYCTSSRDTAKKVKIKG